jgi:hypothetical protein
MSRHELACRFLISLTLISLLALLPSGARAAMPAMQQSQASKASASMPMSHPASVLDDCVPCAYCYMAPAIAMQGFRGRAKELGEYTWPVCSEVPGPASRILSGWKTGQSRVPLRVALCRWSK